jgi:hypothetical protein
MRFCKTALVWLSRGALEANRRAGPIYDPLDEA